MSERANPRATGSRSPNRGREIDGSGTNEEHRMTWTIRSLRLRFIVLDIDAACDYVRAVVKHYPYGKIYMREPNRLSEGGKNSIKAID